MVGGMLLCCLPGLRALCCSRLDVAGLCKGGFSEASFLLNLHICGGGERWNSRRMLVYLSGTWRGGKLEPAVT